MKKKLVIASVLVAHTLNLNAAELNSGFDFSQYLNSFTYVSVIDTIISEVSFSEIESEAVVEVTDEIVITSTTSSADSQVLKEYDDEQLRTEVEHDGEYTTIISYQNEVVTQIQKYRGDTLIEDHYFDANGVIEVSYQFTDYSTIETKYDQGIISSLVETASDVVIRSNTYLDGKITSTSQYTTNGQLASYTTYDSAERVLKHEVYDDDQILSATTNYNAGVVESYYEYYQDGTTKTRSKYSDGHLKVSYQYDRDSVLRTKTSYFTSGSGLGLTSYEQEYDATGTQRKDNRYSEDGTINRTRIYRQSGVIKNLYNYDRELLTSEYRYDVGGNRTLYLSYFANSKIKTRTDYQNDIRTKRRVYTESGVLEKLNIYKPDGSSYASTRTYYTAGKDKGKTKANYYYYKNGTKIQQERQYNPDGTFKSIRYNNKDGKMVERRIYKDGVLSSTTKYNNKGQKTYTYYYQNKKLVRKAVHNPNTSYRLQYYVNNKLVRSDYYNRNNVRYKVVSHLKTQKLKGYTTKKVSVCDMGKTRQKNVVVDIGVDSKYANRDYYGYTNKYGQLVRVDAAQIIAQDETYEKVVWGRSGIGKELRYCKSEAQVPGSEPPKYDKGHVIADSMGGVANAYNITPQIEEINVTGSQAQMEKMFRVAFAQKKTVTDFRMKMSYKNKKTNIPYKYTVTFKIDGKKYNFSRLNKE